MKYLSFLLVALISITTAFSQETELVTQEKNLGIITTLKYSPDGTLIASGSEGDNTIKLWDVRSGKVLGVLSGHESHIKNVSFHPSSDFIVSTDESGQIFLWDLNTWSFIDSLSHDKKVNSFAFDKSGNQLIAGDESGDVLKCNWQEKQSFSKIGNIRGEIVDIQTEMNSGNIAIASDKGELMILNSQLIEMKNESVLSRGTLGIRYYNKGSQIIAADEDGNITIVKSSTLEEESSFEAYNRNLVSFDIHSESNQLVASGKDKTIRLWDLKRQVLIHEFSSKNAISKDGEITEPIQSVIFSSDGNTIATSTFKEAFLTGNIKSKDNVIKIWDIRRKDLYKILEGEVNPITTFTFHPEKNQVITFSGNDVISYWNLNTAEKIGVDTLVERKKEPKVFNKENDEGKSKAGKFLGNVLKGKADLKEAAKDVAIEKTTKVLKRFFRKTDIVKYSAKGNYLFTALPKDELRQYQINEKGRIEHKTHLYHDQQMLNDITTDWEEKYLFCLGSGEEGVSVIDLNTGELVKKLTTQEESRGKLDYFFEGSSLSVSPDNKYLSVAFITGKVFVYKIGSWRKVFENHIDMDFKKVIVSGAFAGFSEDGKRLITNDNNGINVYSVPGFQKQSSENFDIEGEGIPLNRPADFAVTKAGDSIKIESYGSHQTKDVEKIKSDWITHAELNKNKLLGLSMRNGEFKFIDTKTGKEIISLIGEGDKYIFKTPENYYKVSKGGYDLVTFRKGRVAYPFEQFDLIFNRPDIVLEALKCEDQKLIKLYKRAYEKRLQKLGVSKDELSAEVHLPDLSLLNRSELPIVTEKDHLKLKLKASDNKYNLKTLKVWINNVPVWGREGKKIDGNNWSEEVEIPLGAGYNRIQIAVENSKNNLSLYEFVDVELKEEVKPNLYILSVGTSDYQDSRYNLSYAAKDANDLVKLFSKENDIYASVNHKTLTNKEVVKDNFLALKEFVKDAKINDVILVFIAGHGLLSSELDYYYATHNIDFTAPQKLGLEYSQIEYILENILTLKKILIMDTCHSGEVDKDEVSIDLENDEEAQEDIAFRNVGPGIKENEEVSPSKLVKELFTDVRKGTGTTVISSAGGAEFAMESEEWKNGLFTYCLLNGLTNRTADLNGDGEIKLSEIQEYVKNKVAKLSHGRQVPTTRIQNYALDYTVW